MNEEMRPYGMGLVRRLVQALSQHGIETWIFGGWAEELWGLRPPGPHHDIDLLYPAQSFALLDTFIRANLADDEIFIKRFAHKRAFRWDGIMVEVCLVSSVDGSNVTDFFGLHRFIWPEDAFSSTLPAPMEVMRVASPEALTLYREKHGEVEAARIRFRTNIQADAQG